MDETKLLVAPKIDDILKNKELYSLQVTEGSDGLEVSV